MESLELTTPVVVPEQVTTKYAVRTLNLTFELDGMIYILLRNEHGEPFTHTYRGQEAIDLMKWMNTANFSVNSMHKRILQKLSTDGVLPGTVTGTPDP